MKKGDYEKAKQYLLCALTDARKDKKLVLMGPYVKKNILISLSDLAMSDSKSYADEKIKHELYQNAIKSLIEAHKEDISDTFLLYNIAKLYLFSGNNAQAKKYFEEFIQKWDNDVNRQAAEKLLKKCSYLPLACISG